MTDRRENLHYGFDPGSAGDATWSRRAFVRPVESNERFEIRRMYAIFGLVALGLMVGGFVVVAWILFVPGYDHMFDVRNPIIVSGSVAVLAGFGIGLTFGKLLKRIMIRKIERRPGRVFDPNASPCVLVEINQSLNNMKQLLPDDMGLLCSRNGWVDLELAGHRARFPLNELQIVDVSIAVVANVRLTYANELPHWSVLATPVSGLGHGISGGAMQPVPRGGNFVEWNRAGDADRCRICGYELYGVDSDRCPECGAAKVQTSQGVKLRK
jgi:hypothetical protein